MQKSHKNYFLFTLGLIVADQLSKWLAYKYLGLVSYDITSFLALTFAQNYGAAFSFLADSGGWQRYFLSAVSAVASVLLIIWIFKTNPNRKLKLNALVLILAGAFGNMIDRMLNGFVVDFIDLHYGSFNFPIFNLADSFISIGVVLLIWSDKK